MIWIRSHHLHLQWIYKLLAGNSTWGNNAKQNWVMSTNFLLSKVFWQSLPMFCLYTSSKLSRPIIWIFTEGDGIKSRLPFKIFSTIPVQFLENSSSLKDWNFGDFFVKLWCIILWKVLCNLIIILAQIVSHVKWIKFVCVVLAQWMVVDSIQ